MCYILCRIVSAIPAILVIGVNIWGLPFSPPLNVRGHRATLSGTTLLNPIIGLMSEILRHGNDSGLFAPRWFLDPVDWYWLVNKFCYGDLYSGRFRRLWSWAETSIRSRYILKIRAALKHSRVVKALEESKRLWTNRCGSLATVPGHAFVRPGPFKQYPLYNIWRSLNRNSGSPL